VAEEDANPSTIPDLTPQQRLRALELSGDPDAYAIAQKYKSSPLDPMRPLMRQVARSNNLFGGVFEPSFASASKADADEAEREFAKARVRRESQARERDERLFQFASAAHDREQLMIKLTKASVLIAGISALVAVAAVVVAVLA